MCNVEVIFSIPSKHYFSTYQYIQTIDNTLCYSVQVLLCACLIE